MKKHNTTRYSWAAVWAGFCLLQMGPRVLGFLGDEWARADGSISDGNAACAVVSGHHCSCGARHGVATTVVHRRFDGDSSN